MKKLFTSVTLVGLLLACNLVYAQSNLEDVVYLKNGSIIRGIIIEQVPNQVVKIQTKDRNVFVYKVEEIERMTREQAPADYTFGANGTTVFKQEGFTNITEVIYGGAVGEITVGGNRYATKDNSFGFRTVNGGQTNEHFFLGLGVGIDRYENATTLPVTLDARVALVSGRVSPVVNLAGGYALGLKGTDGGLIINPGLGIRTYISENTAFLFNVGMRWQAEKVSYGYYYYSRQTETVFFKFVTVSMGFSF